MIRTRYRRIVLFFGRVLLSLTFWDLLLPRLGMGERSRRTRPERLRKAAAGFRNLAVQMGGVLIKVGQFLSSRVDVLPLEITRELEGLQDEVAPETFQAIRRVAEAEYGVPLEEKFDAFESSPLAAASLGQVHRARLYQSPKSANNSTAANPASGALDSVDVVVKVQRPNIEKIIATDLAALRTVGKWLNRYPPIRKRADVPALLAEFTRILYEEIDYLAEGRNAETFSANFSDYPGVRVPRVVWTHTTRRALTLENVLAIKITDYPAIAEAGVSRQDVASRLLDVYLKQIFEDGFFHADPHPGNLFVQPLDGPPADGGRSSRAWELTFVDFGMVGHVPPNLRLGLREVLIGVGMQDAQRVVKGYQMMDVLLPSADLALLEKAGAEAFDRFWGKNMAEMTSMTMQEMKEFADEFRDLLYDMPFQVPQNLVFLVRCVGILSGMCTGLDPRFNVWNHIAPYAQKIIADEAKTGWEALFTGAEKLGRALVTVPQKMDAILTKMERGEVAVRTPDMSQQAQRLESALRRVTSGIIFAALLLGGIQLLVGGFQVFGVILLVGAGLNLGWLLLTNGRRR